MKARKRLHGDEYVGNQSRVHAVIKEGNPCNCRKQCSVKVNVAFRAQLRQSYYNLPDFTAQRFFLGNCIKCTMSKRQHARPNSKRHKLLSILLVCMPGVSVCKQGLASILYDLYVNKIVSLAQEPVTFRMFQEIFATEQNYHFGQPSLDTCKTCDSLGMQPHYRLNENFI